jgi:hypothetical protein
MPAWRGPGDHRDRQLRLGGRPGGSPGWGGDFLVKPFLPAALLDMAKAMLS